MIRYLIIIILLSITFTQISNKKKYRNLKPNTIDIWENEIENIKNPELKKELMKLNEDFQNQKEHINNDFKEKIKPLKIKKNSDISNLKSEYLNKRKLLFEKYGVKRDHEFKKKGKGKKPLPYYKKDKQKSKK